MFSWWLSGNSSTGDIIIGNTLSLMAEESNLWVTPLVERKDRQTKADMIKCSFFIREHHASRFILKAAHRYARPALGHVHVNESLPRRLLY